MKSFAPISLFALLSLLFLTASAVAQTAAPSSSPSPSASPTEDEPDFIVPSRPTVSNPAEFQRPGVLQLEFGFNSNFRAPGNASEEDFPMALRFAASRRVLVEVDLDNPLSQEVSGMRDTGAGDTQIGIQAVLQHEKETQPGIAIAYYIKLPSAAQAKGLGTGRTDHNFIGFVSKKIGRTTVDFNAIYLLAGRMTNNGHASSGQAALAASCDLTKRWGIQGEISGFSRNDSQPGALFALGAVTYQVNRRLILDSGVRFGLTAGAPRAGAFVGMTVGIADFYKQHRR
jgi:hypothetical protein